MFVGRFFKVFTCERFCFGVFFSPGQRRTGLNSAKRRNSIRHLPNAGTSPLRDIYIERYFQIRGFPSNLFFHFMHIPFNRRLLKIGCDTDTTHTSIFWSLGASVSRTRKVKFFTITKLLIYALFFERIFTSVEIFEESNLTNSRQSLKLHFLQLLSVGSWKM